MTVNLTQFHHKLLWITLSVILLVCQQLSSDARVIVPPETVQERVEAYILESTTMEEPDAELHVELVRPPHENIVLEGEHLEIILSDNRVTDIPWHTIVQVNLSTEEETQQIGVPVQVTVEKPVWVTRRMIRAKSRIEKKDLVMQRKQVDQTGAYVIHASEDISQYTSLVNIPPGQMLDMRKVKKTPAVFRNDDVRILLSMPGGVKVSVFGLAMEDGAVGDRIRVKQKRGDAHKYKTYTGKVIGKNQVLVTM